MIRLLPAVLVGVVLAAPADSAQQPPAAHRKTTKAAATPAEQLVAEGVALLKAQRIDDAAARFDDAAHRDPSLATAHYYLGTVYEQRKDPAAAEREYRRTIELAPSMAAAHDRLGFVLGQQGHTDDAIASFERATTLDPTLSDAQYHLGATRWWINQAQLARPALEAAVRLDPQKAEARYYLGLTLRQLGDLDGAIAQLREIRVSRRRWRLRTSISGSRFAKPAMSMVRWRRCRRRCGSTPNVTTPPTRWGLPTCSAATRISPSRRFARWSNALQRTELRATISVRAYMQKGDLEAAVREFRELTTREPTNAEAFYNLGTALKQQDNFADAEQALRQSIRLRTDLPESHFTLGVVLWQTRHLEDAAASFREALAERPAYAEAHYMLGTVLRQLGQTDEAFAEFQRTLELDSDSAEAWLSIGQILQRRQDKPGSEKAFAEAARLRQKKADQQAATFAISTGMKQLAAGDVAGAVVQLKEAVRLDAQNAQAQYQLGRALQRSGETGQAKLAFDEARRLLAARSDHAK